jgi:hypothetical protein
MTSSATLRRLTPAALSAVSISLSEAMFADTFVTAGPVVPPDGADMLVGAADGDGELSPALSYLRLPDCPV